MVVEGQQDHKEEFAWCNKFSGSIDHLQRCEQTPEILVAGISLSQKYATVRGMYMIHGNQML